MHYACCAVSAVLSNSPVLCSPARSFVCLRLKNPIREQIRHLFDSGLNFLFFARLRGWAAEEKEEDDEDEEEELGIFRGGVLRMEGVQMWGGWGGIGTGSGGGWVLRKEQRQLGSPVLLSIFFLCVSVSREVGGWGGC